MSPAVLDRFEARAHLTVAEVSRAREILRHPRSPRAVERAWRVVASLRALMAMAGPEQIERLGAGPEGFWFVTELLQLSHSKVRDLVTLAAQRGLAKEPWARAMAEALEDLSDTLEALHLSRDPEARAVIEAPLAELESTRSGQANAPAPDWRAALGTMSD